MDDVGLINAVKQHPCLYMRSCAGYTRSSERNNAWSVISTTVNAPVPLCKSRWRSIRDRYVKLVKQAETVGEVEEEFRWELFHHMTFLRKHFGRRSNRKYKRSFVFDQTSMDTTATFFDPISIKVDTSDTCIEPSTPPEPEHELEEMEETVSPIHFTSADNKSRNARISKSSNRHASFLHRVAEKHEPETEPYEIEETVTPISPISRHSHFTSTDNVSRNATILESSSRHAPFLHMVAEKLDQLPDDDGEDIKMYILNQLHNNVKRFRNRKRKEVNGLC